MSYYCIGAEKFFKGVWMERITAAAADLTLDEMCACFTDGELIADPAELPGYTEAMCLLRHELEKGLLWELQDLHVEYVKPTKKNFKGSWRAKLKRTEERKRAARRAFHALPDTIQVMALLGSGNMEIKFG